MGNQNNPKFKPKNQESQPPPEDKFHPSNFPKSRKGSDASAVARSEINPSRRLSGLSPKAFHKRNISEGPHLTITPSSPVNARLIPGDVSTLSTNSTLLKDSDSEVSFQMTLDIDINDNISEPSSATVRQSLKEKRDLQEASEIRPWLFLGGYEVAKSKDYLKSRGITHILNCAQGVCENFHEDSFTYVRSIDLIDASKEEIGNFMLQAVAEIEAVHEDKGKKILVHCQVGSSRSATLVIAYLMWLDDVDETTAFSHVKKLRSIVSPNLGFMCELRAFRERLAYRPTHPVLYRIAPHSKTVGSLVAKLVKSSTTKLPVIARTENLDPRGAFLVFSPADRILYLWVGPDVNDAAEDEAAARKVARETSNLKRHDSFRETYEQGGRRLGKIMSKYEKAFWVDGKPNCQFVQVPTEFDPVKALAEGADQNSLAARFWKTLGERTGTDLGIEKMRETIKVEGAEDNFYVFVKDKEATRRLSNSGPAPLLNAGSVLTNPIEPSSSQRNLVQTKVQLSESSSNVSSSKVPSEIDQRRRSQSKIEQSPTRTISKSQTEDSPERRRSHSAAPAVQSPSLSSASSFKRISSTKGETIKALEITEGSSENSSETVPNPVFTSEQASIVASGASPKHVKIEN